MGGARRQLLQGRPGLLPGIRLSQRRRYERDDVRTESRVAGQVEEQQRTAGIVDYVCKRWDAPAGDGTQPQVSILGPGAQCTDQQLPDADRRLALSHCGARLHPWSELAVLCSLARVAGAGRASRLGRAR